MTSTAPAQSDISFDDLRRKWQEIPSGVGSRCRSEELLAWSDDRLRDFWQRQLAEYTTGRSGFPVRGWYHTLYRPLVANRRVLDVGSGLGFDGITFARAGAHVTFLDIVPGNLAVLERLAAIEKLDQVEFFHMEDVESLERLTGTFDVIWVQGSLIHIPYPIACRERAMLMTHLPIGGRWIELTYPRSRWERDGRLPFEQWGAKTDGAGTPWVEWYDLEKLHRAMQPATFDTVLSFEFADGQFQWFDLIRRA